MLSNFSDIGFASSRGSVVNGWSVAFGVALESRPWFSLFSSFFSRLPLISASLVYLSLILILSYCSVGCNRPRSVSKSLNQVVYFALYVNNTYLAFIDERVTVA